MKLTIGMAVYEDFNGVYFTIQALRLFHDCSNVEFLVIDNKPDTQQAELTRRFIENWPKHGSAGARYIPLSSPVGTTVPRDEIFREAAGDAVLCMDSHVLLKRGAIDRLIEFYQQNPGTQDLLCGPMMMDDLATCMTHFDDTWRGEMWGTWGVAWQCPCGGSRFSVLPSAGSGAAYRALSMGHQLLAHCSRCGKALPETAYGGHEVALRRHGFELLADNEEGGPFEVPGQGLGLFSCRKDAWLGFNRNFRGFGGEEMYIHEKYRRAGHRVLCLPFLKWGHRFGRPGVPYPLTRWNKVRNYVLGHQELGLPLDRVREHFHAGVFSEAEWNHLLADPVGHVEPPTPAAKCGGCSTAQTSGLPQPPQDVEVTSPAALLGWCKGVKRDLDQHLDKLASLAAECSHVTEISKRRESLVALLSAKQVVSYNQEALDPLVKRIAANHSHVSVLQQSSTDLREIAPTDLLFIDSQHTADRLIDELHKFAASVSRFIVLHDTQLYGEVGEDKGPGLLAGLRRFLREQPEWSVIYHTQEQHGLTVIGRDQRDKPKLPSTMTIAANFAKAMAAYVADGAKHVDSAVYQSRLEQCSLCDQRRDGRCAVCGCFLEAKAKHQVSTCPLGKWAA